MSLCPPIRSLYLSSSSATLNVVYSAYVILPFKIFQFNSQLHLFCGGQTVKIVVSKPELTTQIAKPSFVGCPFAIEVNRSIHTSLKHGSASTLRHHITQNFYWLAAIWNDGIYTTGNDTFFTKL